MKCHACGGHMSEDRSDMPFKLDRERIVIIKDLPVLVCAECGEHAFTDPVMKQIEEALDKVGGAAELEIVRYVAA
jgi:YgiT-type zinc finger domain-containing protein